MLQGNLLEQLNQLRDQVANNSSQVADRGKWPHYIDRQCLVARVPSLGSAPGFDAGIACCLDIIPRDKQALSAALHAAYTPDLVAQVLRDMAAPSPDSESVWWLAMSSLCREKVSARDFLHQVSQAHVIANDSEKRVEKAVEQQAAMFGRVKPWDFNGMLPAPIAYGTKDGCIQGAYLAGHQFAVCYNDVYGIYYIGSYLPSLGLENFQWLDPDRGTPGTDDFYLGTSGPVWGSRNYVKCSTIPELIEAVKQINLD